MQIGKENIVEDLYIQREKERERRKKNKGGGPPNK